MTGCAMTAALQMLSTTLNQATESEQNNLTPLQVIEGYQGDEVGHGVGVIVWGGKVGGLQY